LGKERRIKSNRGGLKMESMGELRKKIKDCDSRKKQINLKWGQKRDVLEGQISLCYENVHRIEKEIKKSHRLEAGEIAEIDRVRSEFKKKLKPYLPPPDEPVIELVDVVEENDEGWAKEEED